MRKTLVLVGLIAALLPSIARAQDHQDAATVNLSLQDVPAGFTTASDVNRSNATVAKENKGTTIQILLKQGRMTSNELIFQSGGLAGMVLIDSLVEQFKTAADAKANTLQGLNAAVKQKGSTAQSTAHVGVLRYGFQYVTKDKAKGLTEYADIVVFCRGAFEVTVITGSTVTDSAPGTASHLAEIIDRRILAG